MAAESVARGMPGTISAATPLASRARSSGGKPGKSRRAGLPRMSPSPKSRRSSTRTTKLWDLLVAPAHEERRAFDRILDEFDALAFEEQPKLRRREHRRDGADGAQRLEASQGEEIWVARSEPDDADHPRTVQRLGGTTSLTLLLSERRWRELQPAVPAAAGAAVAGAGTLAKSLKRSSETVIVAWLFSCCKNAGTACCSCCWVSCCLIWSERVRQRRTLTAGFFSSTRMMW